jgi:hypothetical protein
MIRKTVRNWTLSDGTVIPPDVYVGLAAEEMNKAEVCWTFVPPDDNMFIIEKQESFPDGRTFKGFRFAEMRNGDGELDSIKHQMVCLSPESVLFGHGKHAWYVIASPSAASCSISTEVFFSVQDGS